MKNMALAVMALLIASGPAHADYRAEYNRYMEAFNAGNLNGAIGHSEAAWRAAEAELGDHATTAVLALNYANLISPYAPDRALKAYERALAITRMGYGSLNLLELELRAAEIRLLLDIGNRDFGEALEEVLDRGRSAAGAPPRAMALGWKTLAIHQSQRGRIREAKEEADLAIDYARAIDPREPRLLAETLVLGATLRLATPYKKEEDIFEMVTFMDEAFPLFPPQPSIDNFDPLLARAIQLRETARAFAESVEFTPFIGRGTDTRLKQRENLAEAYARADAKSPNRSQVTWSDGSSSQCPASYVWAERKPPNFPRQAQQRNYIGAVVVGYDMSDTGVERAVLLADAEQAGFGEAALKSVEEWKLGQTVPLACRKNHIASFIFYFVP